jgi:hypothetical protein
MVQSGLRRTVGVWINFIVGVKGLAVDWKLDCGLRGVPDWRTTKSNGSGNEKRATAEADPPPSAKDDNKNATANAEAGFSTLRGAGRAPEWVA